MEPSASILQERTTMNPISAKTRFSQPLPLVHTDSPGKINQQSIAESCNFTVFMDGWAATVLECFLRERLGLLAVLKTYNAAVENPSGLKLFGLRLVQAGEQIRNYEKTLEDGLSLELSCYFDFIGELHFLTNLNLMNS